MTNATLIRTATSAALIVMTLLGRSTPVTAADPGRDSPPTVQILRRQGGAVHPARRRAKASWSTCLATSRTCWWPIPRSPTRSFAPSRRAYIIGVAVGQTNVYFFDAEGRQLMAFDIAVTRDLNGHPRGDSSARCRTADIAIEGLADGIMLTGSVASPTESQQAFDLAARLAGDGNKVVNGITVRGRDQVMLKVTVAEIQRDVIKQLGIDLSGTICKADRPC